MLTVGLTGGMACGKSFVARALGEMGCHVIEADELGHEVMRRDGDAWREVISAFGPGILNPEGDVDRALLAARVFDSPAVEGDRKRTVAGMRLGRIERQRNVG